MVWRHAPASTVPIAPIPQIEPEHQNLRHARNLFLRRANPQPHTSKTLSVSGEFTSRAGIFFPTQRGFRYSSPLGGNLASGGWSILCDQSSVPPIVLRTACSDGQTDRSRNEPRCAMFASHVSRRPTMWNPRPNGGRSQRKHSFFSSPTETSD